MPYTGRLFISFIAVASALVLSTSAEAQDFDSAGNGIPDQPESVYGTPPLREPGEGFNDGAVRFDLHLHYKTDYVFRGIEPVEPSGSEDTINFNLDARLTFDLGRLPDPFVGVVTNTAQEDDISRFQVIRPVIGLRWDLELFTIEAGHQSFTYPDRDDLGTSEVFADVQLNDAAFFGEEGTFLGPYVFAAYDYDTFEGIYIEGGLRREGRIGDSSLTLGYHAHVAYIDGLGDLFSATGDSDVSGFQHYQVGLTARYELNTLLNISRRYGQWSIEGFLNYTDGIDNDLFAETQLWGGGGIVFQY